MRRIGLVLVAAAVVVLVAVMALASPAAAEGDGAIFKANECANLHTIVPPADFIILSLQGTTVTTPAPLEPPLEICAPKPTGGKNQKTGVVEIPL